MAEKFLDSISGRWINKLLRRAKIRPHKNKYWLTSKDKADPLYDQRVSTVCHAYHEAIEAYERQGIHTICIDEQTGIQALERIAPDLPVRPGMPSLREYEYTRHGTLCLFGNFHVATGQVLCPMIRQTRTEIDYLENLDNLILQDPKAGYRIIADNLTTHCSESLVRYIADRLHSAAANGSDASGSKENSPGGGLEVSEPNKLSPASTISLAVGFQRRNTNSRLDLSEFSLGSTGARLPHLRRVVWCR